MGKIPTLKINRLETETDKNIQEGTGYILKGIMLSIRNPRSHQKYHDTKEDADSIILFLNYILKIIDKAKQPYLIDDLVSYLFGKEIPYNCEFAEELFKEIPKKKRLDLLIEVFRNSAKIKDLKLRNIVSILIEHLTPEERNDFFDFISRFLNDCDDYLEWCGFFYIYPEERWTEIKQLSKLRAEHFVQKSIVEGIYGYIEDYDHQYHEDDTEEVLNGGDLAIIAKNHITYFETKKTILKSLYENDNEDHIKYIVKYFNSLVFDFDWSEELSFAFIQGTTAVLLKHNEQVYKIISCKIKNSDSRWTENFGEACKDVKNFFEEKQKKDEKEMNELPF